MGTRRTLQPACRACPFGEPWIGEWAGSRIERRFFAAAAIGVAGAAGAAQPARGASGPLAGLAAHFAAEERQAGGRLGAAVADARTGARALHRDGERFPMASTFQLLLAGATRTRADRGEKRLDRPVAYTNRLRDGLMEDAIASGGWGHRPRPPKAILLRRKSFPSVKGKAGWYYTNRLYDGLAEDKRPLAAGAIGPGHRKLSCFAGGHFHQSKPRCVGIIPTGSVMDLWKTRGLRRLGPLAAPASIIPSFRLSK